MEEVTINPITPLPELTQDWGNGLLGGTRTLCTPGPREPTETELELYLSVSCGGKVQQWLSAGTGVLAAAELGGAACGMNPLGGDRH